MSPSKDDMREKLVGTSKKYAGYSEQQAHAVSEATVGCFGLRLGFGSSGSAKPGCRDLADLRRLRHETSGKPEAERGRDPSDELLRQARVAFVFWDLDPNKGMG